MPPTVDEAAFDAAYDALLPYVQHAQVRAAIASHIAAVLHDYHPYAAVTVASETWPANTARLSRTVLAEAVTAAHHATERSTP